jgi:formate hydrogenlyase subunit 3/multisubunit Na+/H+ antiporter MnhD subunit
MLLIITFGLPLAVALLCMALNQLAATRTLGLAAAASCAAMGATLLAAHGRGETLPVRAWSVTDTHAIRLALELDGLSLGLGLLVCFGGALALAALALALPSKLRGFGALFATLLLALLTTLIGLMLQERALVPVAWALTTILTFGALRSSGAQPADPPLPLGLLAGLVSALALLGASMSLISQAPTDPPTTVVLVSWTLAAMLAFGAAPLHGTLDEITAAPTGLAAPLLGLTLPLLAGVMLLREAAALVELTPHWQTALGVLGLLSLLACSAGALRERRAGRLLGWLMSAQMGLLLVALGLPSPVPTTAGPALLLNTGLTTLTAFLAFEPLERSAGTDHLAELPARGRLLAPGIAMLIAAASAAGLPGTWGFWAHQWLSGAPGATPPGVVPLLLAGRVLLACAYLAPLAALWRAAPEPSDPAAPPSAVSRIAQLLPLPSALALLALGVAPQIGWQRWGAAAQQALLPGTSLPPALPGVPAQIICGAAALGLLLLPLALRAARRRPQRDPEDRAAIQTPDALGESLAVLAWLGAPSGLFERALEGLIALSRNLRRLLALLEQRYYVAGLILALIGVILLML